MKVLSETIQIHSAREGDIIDITEQLSNVVKESKIKNGIVTIFVSGRQRQLQLLNMNQDLFMIFRKCYLE